MNRSQQLRQTVLSIISSRLQYIKHKQEKLFSKKDEVTGNDVPMQITDENSAVIAHHFLLKFEEYSRSIRLLLLMRSMLRPRNTVTIFELLTDDRYLKYSPEILRSLLETKRPPLSGSTIISQVA